MPQIARTELSDLIIQDPVAGFRKAQMVVGPALLTPYPDGIAPVSPEATIIPKACHHEGGCRGHILVTGES